MKHYYIREAGGDNTPITKEVGENLLDHRGYRVFEETDALCIIIK